MLLPMGQGMRVLFCTYGFVDCGLDALYDGLCQVLGPESVLEHLTKDTLHGGRRNSYLWYPSFFDYPVAADNDAKIEMLRRGEFDVILMACRSASDFTHTRYDSDPQVECRELLVEKSKEIPTFLIDQDDSDGLNADLIDEMSAVLYFKREYEAGRQYDPRVVPLGLSYSSRYVSFGKESERASAVFWAGKPYYWREPYITACEGVQGRSFYSRLKQRHYSKKLAGHRIGLSLPGYGQDTVRYYEVPAHGALLLSQRLTIHIENDFIDGETAVFFGDVDEMVDKLKFFTAHEEHADRIRIAGRAWYEQHHTSAARARQMLAEIEAAL